ncbi:MAG: pyridoxamine 5'-phosphate oxidase family protein [Paracoccus sp.]|nr:pyridoxamine 5'-phosphate oxidase family protein [Paracoccus sp. (in: a-proteobacteria)]
MIIQEFSAAQCAALIQAGRLARLACSMDNRPYLVPIYYAYADQCAYAFTMPGRKLDTMRANPNVALLVEQEGEKRAWSSVVAEGLFEELTDRIGHKRLRERAWSLLSKHVDWWEPGALKPVRPALADRSPHVFFRIHVERMSGREALGGVKNEAPLFPRR